MRYFLFLVMVASALAQQSLTPPINNFNVGQVSPLMDARTDSPAYTGGSRTQQNMIPRAVGDISKRPGTVLAGSFGPMFPTGAYPKLHILDASERPTTETAPVIADGTTPIATGAALMAALDNDPTGSYILTADLDCTGIDWIPPAVGVYDSNQYFSGILDGNGYTIRNLDITDRNYYGDQQWYSNFYYKTATDYVNMIGHEYVQGDKVLYRSNGGDAYPTPLVDNTYYWVIYIDASNIQLATSAANAALGTQIDILDNSGSGSNWLIRGTRDPSMLGHTAGAQVKDLNFENCSVTVESTSDPDADMHIGVLFGWGTGTLDISNLSFDNCRVTHYDSHGGGSAGSMGGYWSGTKAEIFDVTVTNAQIKGNSNNGGMLGQFGYKGTSPTLESNIVGCSSTDVIITNVPSLSTAGDATDSDFFGGLIGQMFGGDALLPAGNGTEYTNIHDCYSTGNINSSLSGIIAVGGLWGFSDELIEMDNCWSSVDITCTMIDSADYASTIGGLIGGESTFLKGTSSYATGDIIINTNYKTYSIGGFIGSQDQTFISNLKRCYATGDIYIHNNGSDGEVNAVGGFVGLGNSPSGPYGTVDTMNRCWAEGDITITAPVSATSTEIKAIGGFIGRFWAQGATTNSYTWRDCYTWTQISLDNPDAYTYIGGFFGYADLDNVNCSLVIDNCYSAQTDVRTGSFFSNELVWSTGTIGGFHAFTGGNDPIGTVTTTNSFFDTSTAGITYTLSGAGHETCWMFTKQNYEDAGWAFSAVDQVKGTINDIWYMPDSDACTGLTAAGQPATAVRIIPFVFNFNDSYILAFDDGRLGFSRTVSGVSGEIQQ
jgi:hypothetical protein